MFHRIRNFCVFHCPLERGGSRSEPKLYTIYVFFAVFAEGTRTKTPEVVLQPGRYDELSFLYGFSPIPSISVPFPSPFPSLPSPVSSTVRTTNEYHPETNHLFAARCALSATHNTYRIANRTNSSPQRVAWGHTPSLGPSSRNISATSDPNTHPPGLSFLPLVFPCPTLPTQPQEPRPPRVGCA